MAKEKKPVKLRYFKLGKTASSFSDSTSGLMIRGQKEVVSIPNKHLLHGDKSRVTEALDNGHIIEVKEDEWDEGMTLTKLPLPEIHTTIIRPGIKNNQDDLDDEELEEEEDEKEEDNEDDKDDEKEEDKKSPKPPKAPKVKKPKP